VRLRWLGLAAPAAAAFLLAGCGSSAPARNEASGSQLAVYSSLPLQGPWASDSAQIVNGEKLALADADGRAGRFKVAYVSLDDSSPTSGRWNPGVTATDAKIAAQDPSTIAYLGDFDSGATAISMFLMNEAGIAQVSPASPYVGLTSSEDAGQAEPERFYPTGRRNFARIAPGDIVEAQAQAKLMRTLGIKKLYVLADQEDPFVEPLANLVASAAARAGITVVGRDSISTAVGTVFGGEAEKVAGSGAQAVFYAGQGSEGAATLWRTLHATDPRLLLLGSSLALDEGFLSQIGPAAASTYATTPVLPASHYPPSAQRVLRAYQRDFGGEGGPYALYGYEAMSLVLDAIRAAGVHGNDRALIVDHILATRDRNSVIGRYSIDANGETSSTRYGSVRVVAGRPVFFRTLSP
jgi:branched-chain amino acid transport system substrate-binding protein